jgi:hypothetical protein
VREKRHANPAARQDEQIADGRTGRRLAYISGIWNATDVGASLAKPAVWMRRTCGRRKQRPYTGHQERSPPCGCAGLAGAASSAPTPGIWNATDVGASLAKPAVWMRRTCGRRKEPVGLKQPK